MHNGHDLSLHDSEETKKKMEYWFFYIWTGVAQSLQFWYSSTSFTPSCWRRHSPLCSLFPTEAGLPFYGYSIAISMEKFSWNSLLSSELYHDAKPSYLHGVESLSFPRIPNIRRKLHWAFPLKTCSFEAQISHAGASLNTTIITFSYQMSIFIYPPYPYKPLLPTNPLYNISFIKTVKSFLGSLDFY